jgi:hypothetical protein
MKVTDGAFLGHARLTWERCDRATALRGIVGNDAAGRLSYARNIGGVS